MQVHFILFFTVHISYKHRKMASTKTPHSCIAQYPTYTTK